MSEWGSNPDESLEKCPLVAELVTPFNLGPYVIRWYAQMFIAGIWWYFYTTGFVPGSDVLFLPNGFGSRPFRPTVPVVPDN